MRVPLAKDAKNYGAIEVVNHMSNDQSDDNDPSISGVIARFVGQALQQAEDDTLTEGGRS